MFTTRTAYPFGHLSCLGVMMVKLQNQHCYHHRQTNDDHDASEILSCKQKEDLVKGWKIQRANNIPWPCLEIYTWEALHHIWIPSSLVCCTGGFEEYVSSAPSSSVKEEVEQMKGENCLVFSLKRSVEPHGENSFVPATRTMRSWADNTHSIPSPRPPVVPAEVLEGDAVLMVPLDPFKKCHQFPTFAPLLLTGG